MSPPPIISYLRLMRFPNVFTAIADIAMGIVFAAQSFSQDQADGLQRGWPIFLILGAASALMYLAGMILNDVYDIDVDREQRPHRPLPAGEVSLPMATALGYGFLAAGCLLGCASGFLFQSVSGLSILPWRGVVFSLLLAGSIVGYDRILKKTPLAPIAMGACRFFNVLLGMSLAAEIGGPAWCFQLTPPYLVVAGGIGLYIAGVTLFARTEAVESNRGLLAAGLTVMICGLALLASLALLDLNALPFPLPQKTLYFWPALLLLISLSIIRISIAAVINPEPRAVQAAVKQSIYTLVILDASVAMIAAHSQPMYAVAIVALLAPMLLVGRWIYST